MANDTTPFGLSPKYRDGAASANFAIGRYYLPSTDSVDMFIGDPVNLAGSADSYGTAPTIIKTTAAGTNYSVGVIVGFESDPGDFSTPPKKRTASTARYAFVSDDEDIVFAIRANGAIAVTDIGNTASFVHATGDAVGGSGTMLDSSTIGTGTQIVILKLFDAPDNALGTNAIVLAKFNLHQKRNTTGV